MMRAAQRQRTRQLGTLTAALASFLLGDAKDGPQGEEEAEVFEGFWQGRRKRDAALQEGHRQKRPRRQGRQGQEPQAGHRHRPLQGAQEGQEGTQKEIALKRRLSFMSFLFVRRGAALLAGEATATL